MRLILNIFRLPGHGHSEVRHGAEGVRPARARTTQPAAAGVAQGAGPHLQVLRLQARLRGRGQSLLVLFEGTQLSSVFRQLFHFTSV